MYIYTNKMILQVEKKHFFEYFVWIFFHFFMNISFVFWSVSVEEAWISILVYIVYLLDFITIFILIKHVT